MKEKDPTYEKAVEAQEDVFTEDLDTDDVSADETVADETVADETATGISLKEYIKEESREDERPQGTRLSLRKILGGDILYTSAIRKQIWLMMLIIGFFVLYISNRYSCQKDEVEIARLTKQLKNSQYKALAISSELTEHCRESHVLEMLKENNDSTLHTADQPPYIVIVNEDE